MECTSPTTSHIGVAGRFLIALSAALAIVASLATPAAASDNEFGEMVDYDLAFPVDGSHRFSDTFWAPRSDGLRLHSSQDIFAAKTTPVRAVAKGRVRLVNWSSDPTDLNPERCCSVVIDHGDGWQSTYIHLDNDTTGTDDGKGWGIAKAIAPGKRVKAGQKIGWTGDSGNAEDTEPHLHFELRDPNGVLVNSFEALVAAGGNGKGSSVDPLFRGSRVVTIGDKGADVRRLQEVLTSLDFEVGPVDGWFGSHTERAVIDFQRRYRLDADGAVGVLSKGALAGLLRPDGSVVGFGRSNRTVRSIQRALNARGLDAGVADGVFGPRTLEAVVRFQRTYSLQVDGLVGPQTRSALGLR